MEGQTKASLDLDSKMIASDASLTLNARPKIQLSAVTYTMCKRDQAHKSYLKYSYKDHSKITKKHIVKCSLTNSGAKYSF